jgi:hypothetical protein
MCAIDIRQAAQDKFLKSFEEKFNKPASCYNLNDWYSFDLQPEHWLAFDKNDPVSNYEYLKKFLSTRQFIKSRNYDSVGHERIIKSEQVINDMVEVVKAHLLTF